MDDTQFCTTCGRRRHGTYRFCGQCGTPFAAADVAEAPDTPGTAEPATRPVPIVAAQPGRAPAPAGAASGSWTAPAAQQAPVGPSGQWAVPARACGLATRGWTVAAFTRGDWAGAAVAVAAGVGAAIVLAGAAVLLTGVADLPGVSAGNVVAFVAMVVALAFGGSVTLSASTSFSFADTASPLSGGGVDGSPLLITAAGLTALTAVFLHRLRARRAGLVDVVTQAVRVWVLLLAALLVVGLVGRTAPDPTLTGSGGPRLVLGAGIAGTLFGATVWLLLVLTLAVAWRLPAVLPARVRVWRDRAAGPAAGAAVTVVVAGVLLLVGGLVAALLDGGSSLPTPVSTADIGPVVAFVLLFAPNLLLGAFGFASGVPVTLAADTSVSGGLSAGMSRSLLDATAMVPQLWLAPLAVAVALLTGGVVTALHAPDVDTARRYGWAMGAALAVVLGVIAVATSVSANGSLLGASLGGTVHLNYVLAPVAGLVWGALAGALGGVLAPNLPVPVVQTVRRHVLGAQHRAAGVPVPAPRPAGRG